MRRKDAEFVFLLPCAGVRKLGKHTLFLALFFGTCTVTFAQNYPNGQIKILVGFPPGGTTDIIARDVGQELEKA